MKQEKENEVSTKAVNIVTGVLLEMISILGSGRAEKQQIAGTITLGILAKARQVRIHSGRGTVTS